MSTPPGAYQVVDLTESPVPQPLFAASTGGSKQLMSGAALIISGMLSETSGTAVARVRIRDGIDTTGQVVAVLGAAAGGYAHTDGGPVGIPITIGIYVEFAAGASEVALTYVPATTLG